MADYIKLRVAAARLGVTMAFFALTAGLADRARAATPWSGRVNADLLSPTPPEFLKIKSADASFLKIDDANSNFLKFDDANASFLKIDDANHEFLKIDSSAANASELGGLTPDAFFQGSGHVVSGSASVPLGAPSARLLALPGGIIVVNVLNTVGGGLELVLQNNSSVALPAVQDNGGQQPAAPFTIPAGQAVSVPVVTPNGAGQIHIQIFPAGAAFPDVVTIIVSSENLTGGGTQTLVGQAFTGVPS
jgi:hypothetical protein